jgi:hypothetical protein
MSDYPNFYIIQSQNTKIVYGVAAFDTVHAMEALAKFTMQTAFNIITVRPVEKMYLGYWNEAIGNDAETYLFKIYSKIDGCTIKQSFRK